MEKALDIVASFLSKYGGLEESNTIVETMMKMGYNMDDNAELRWRMLIATMRKVVDESNIDYSFLFSSLIQLHYHMPKDLSKAVLNSPLFFHIIVEIFANIRLQEERVEEILHTEFDVKKVVAICRILHVKLYGKNKSTPLKVFVEHVEDLLSHCLTLSGWGRLVQPYVLPLASFRRDMKRALCLIEKVMFGKTAIEEIVQDELLATATVISFSQLSQAVDISQSTFDDLDTVHSIPYRKSKRQKVRHATTSATIQNNNGVSIVRLPFSPRVVLSGRRSKVQTQSTGTENGHWFDGNESISSSSGTESIVYASHTVHDLPSRPVTIKREQAEAILDDQTGEMEIGETTPRPRRRKFKRWSKEEEEAVEKGYEKFGSQPNVWILIKREYPELLQSRSNVDIKDKFRNICKYKNRQENMTNEA